MEYKNNFYKLRMEKNFLAVTNTSLEMFFLDDIASIIYLVLDSPKSIDEIANIIIGKYSFDVDKSVLIQDIADLLCDLNKHGLVDAL